MLLLGAVLAFFLIGAVTALFDSWGSLRKEWTTSHETESRKSAQRLLDDRKRALANEEPLAHADVKQYAFRGYRYYETNQSALEALGCRVLGDFALDQPEWVHPGLRSFVRVMVSDDRQVACGIIDVTAHTIGMSPLVKFIFYKRGSHRLYNKTVSLRTELKDGRFVITSLDAAFIVEDSPPEITRENMPRNTTVAALMERHRARVAQAVAHQKTTVVPIGSQVEFDQSWVRHQRRMRAYREKVGFAFTPREEQEFAARGTDFDRSGGGKRVFDAMRSLEDDERQQAS